MTRPVAALLVFSLLPPSPIGAQDSLDLRGLESTVAKAEFIRLESLRELNSEKTLIVDRGDRRLLLVDWIDSTIRVIGRQGDGPGEYRSPFQLVPFGRDSTVLIDAAARRWLWVVSDDSLRSFAPEVSLRLSRNEAPIYGVGPDGTFLSVAPLPYEAPRAHPRRWLRPSEADSLVAIRSRLTVASIDTIARLVGRFLGRSEVSRSQGGRKWVFGVHNPMGVEEQAWLFSDGWIAILRLLPYRVDWRRPDGTTLRGKALEVATVRATDAEKRFSMRGLFPKMPPPAVEPREVPGWPELVPPVVNEALLPMPDGRLLVERRVTATSTYRAYDLIDRRGIRTARVIVPLSTRLLGVGAAHLYAVWTDADGIERLQRFDVDIGMTGR